MSACVLGMVVWKALDARTAALEQSERDIRNLTHSLAEHASHTIQSADVAMSGMVDLMRYRWPEADRFNLFMRNTVQALPQLREIGVLDAAGNWIYSSLPETPSYNNSDRNYFSYHRDSSDPSIRINEPVVSRLTGQPTIILSKRITNPQGAFGGVLLAGVDIGYFDNFYKAFKLGPNAGITMLRIDGTVLVRWPEDSRTSAAAISPAFKANIERNTTGYSRVTSPFDGQIKYLGFERASRYALVLTVALPETTLLARWRNALRSDAIVAGVLLCSVVLLAILLWAQLRSRRRIENALRDREAHYRLLADNIADVVILLDRNGEFRFVSQSVEAVLGLKPADLIGRRYMDFVHPDDMAAVAAATAELTNWTVAKKVPFRTWRADGSIAWVEINFKLAGGAGDHKPAEIVGTLRDVSQRKVMEDELNALNVRLAELATIDGLTGLANRRTFDAALRREFGHRAEISVMMLDIDNFKGFNDTLGHQAGDECIKRVAAVIAEATKNTLALAARYGGEEFAIILPDVGEHDALKVAEAIRLTVRSLNVANPGSNRGLLSISSGIAGRTAATASETMLVGDADLALYEAKRRGRDCCVASSSLHQGDAAQALTQYG